MGRSVHKASLSQDLQVTRGAAGAEDQILGQAGGPPPRWDEDWGQRERLFGQRAALRSWGALSRGWAACVDGGLTGSAWVGPGCSGEGGSPGTESSVGSGRFVGRGCGMGLWTHRAGEEGRAQGPLTGQGHSEASPPTERGAPHGQAFLLFSFGGSLGLFLTFLLWGIILFLIFWLLNGKDQHVI